MLSRTCSVQLCPLLALAAPSISIPRFIEPKSGAQSFANFHSPLSNVAFHLHFHFHFQIRKRFRFHFGFGFWVLVIAFRFSVFGLALRLAMRAQEWECCSIEKFLLKCGKQIAVGAASCLGFDSRHELWPASTAFRGLRHGVCTTIAGTLPTATQEFWPDSQDKGPGSGPRPWRCPNNGQRRTLSFIVHFRINKKRKANKTQRVELLH